MAAKVALILFGLFIGVILGITGMSLIVVSPFFMEAKALGDISNLVGRGWCRVHHGVHLMAASAAT
jgi:hypothetical protein